MKFSTTSAATGEPPNRARRDSEAGLRWDRGDHRRDGIAAAGHSAAVYSSCLAADIPMPVSDDPGEGR